ncbi:MAG: hypothetical protein R6U64_04800 [Bacteroidales bacterium]
MDFPVSNKPTAYLKGAFIFMVLIIIFASLYFHFQDIKILIALLVLIIPVSAYLFSFLRKQNIKSLRFADNSLIVSHGKDKIEIPLSQIHTITAGINLGLDLRFNLVKTYTIQLNKKYAFGDKILVDYRTNEDGRVTMSKDPISIKVLKTELQRLNKK